MHHALDTLQVTEHRTAGREGGGGVTSERSKLLYADNVPPHRHVRAKHRARAQTFSGRTAAAVSSVGIDKLNVPTSCHCMYLGWYVWYVNPAGAFNTWSQPRTVPYELNSLDT